MESVTRTRATRVAAGVVALLLAPNAVVGGQAGAQAASPVITLSARDGTTYEMTSCDGASEGHTDPATLTVTTEPAAVTDLHVTLTLEGRISRSQTTKVVVIPGGGSAVTVELDLRPSDGPVTVTVGPGAYEAGDPSSVEVIHLLAVGDECPPTSGPTATTGPLDVEPPATPATPAAPLRAEPQFTG